MSVPKPKIEVLTPNVDSCNNQYLSNLWSSVTDYGVTVYRYPLNCRFSQIKEGRVSDKIIHLHWVREFCELSDYRRHETIRSILSAIRRLVFLKSCGNRFVWTVHNTFTHGARFPKLEYLLRLFLSYFCEDIIVMSEYSKTEFFSMYGRKKRVHVLPHGNYIGTYSDDTERGKSRQLLGISNDQKVFLHLGRIERYKGTVGLITEFSKIRDHNAVLIVAGACKELSLRRELEKAASGNSRIKLQLQFIKDEDIQIYMAACDWVVLPYKRILNSGSVMLAISFRRPVISPNKGSIIDIIEDGETGFLYENDSDLLTTICKAIDTSNDRWQLMCEKAYSVAESYSWKEIGHQLYKIYSGVACM